MHMLDVPINIIYETLFPHWLVPNILSSLGPSLARLSLLKILRFSTQGLFIFVGLHTNFPKHTNQSIRSLCSLDVGAVLYVWLCIEDKEIPKRWQTIYMLERRNLRLIAEMRWFKKHHWAYKQEGTQSM